MNLFCSTAGRRLLLLIFLSACGAKETPVTRDPTNPLGDFGNVTTDPAAPGNTDPGNPTLPSTEYCKPKDNQNYPEDILISKGEVKEGDGYFWSKGGTCIHRPIQSLWPILLNHELMKWDGVTSISARGLPPISGIQNHYEITYFVDDFIDVDWTMEWFHTVKQGSVENPRVLLVNYQRTRGTRFVPYWEGSIVLTMLTPDVTAFAMVNQIRASRTTVDDAQGTVTDLILKLRTK